MINPPTGRSRPRRRRTPLVLVLAVITSLALAAPAWSDPANAATVSAPAALAPVTVAQTHQSTRYALVEPVCHVPHAGFESCMALRRVAVPRGTPGAVPYRTLTGATGPDNGYSPRNLAEVYGVNPAAATTMTVAVIDAYDNPRILSELNNFDRQYGLPPETGVSFRKVNQGGGTFLPPVDWGWAAETALDVQAVRGMCNRCNILLVEAKDASTRNLADAVGLAARMGADIITTSYGGPEAGVNRSELLAYRQPGVVITAATGDDGWYDWDFINLGGGAGGSDVSDSMPNAPASLPSVVAVGGTSLVLNADGSRARETVWDSNGVDNNGSYVGASGGGCSLRFRATAWQRAVAGYASTGCGASRMAGDISALADPLTGFSVYAPDPNRPGSDSWQVMGGTSLASPLVAGMYGLAGGSGGVRYPSESLYLTYARHPSWAHDITTGGNGFCGGDTAVDCAKAVRTLTDGATGNPNNLADGSGNWFGLLDCGFAYDGSQRTVANRTQCYAAPGYDGPSGVGTVNGIRLLRPARSLVAARR